MWIQILALHHKRDFLCATKAKNRTWLTFIDLTKAFDLVSRKGLFAILFVENIFNMLKFFTQTRRQLFRMMVIFLSHLQSEVG